MSSAARPAAAMALLAITAPMFFYGLSQGIVQPTTQSGAVAPFPANAGAAARCSASR